MLYSLHRMIPRIVTIPSVFSFESFYQPTTSMSLSYPTTLCLFYHCTTALVLYHLISPTFSALKMILDPSGKLMMLPSDLVLIQDEAFKVYVDLYAKDQKVFFKDFAIAFQKLEELGCENLQKT